MKKINVNDLAAFDADKTTRRLLHDTIGAPLDAPFYNYRGTKLDFITSAKDASGAVRGEGADCVLARSCDRQLDGLWYFYRNVAYQFDGLRVVKYAHNGKAVVTGFDATGVGTPHTRVTLFATKTGGMRVGDGTHGSTGVKRSAETIAKQKHTRDRLMATAGERRSAS